MTTCNLEKSYISDKVGIKGHRCFPVHVYTLQITHVIFLDEWEFQTAKEVIGIGAV